MTETQESEDLIDRQRQNYSFNFANFLRTAKADLNKGYFDVVKEVFHLSRGSGKLSAQEYVFFRLYDDRLYSPEQKDAFMGVNAMRYLNTNLSNIGKFIAIDKLIVNGFLGGLGLPTTKTFALYHPFRAYGLAKQLRNPEELAYFLRQEAPYPFFSKPVAKVNSIGVVSAEEYDAKSDSLILKDGRSLPVEEFVREVESYTDHGYCFQERLRQNPEIDEICGDRLSGFRVLTIMGDKGPEILRASWKVVTGDHPADNFWRRGNLLAAIDVESGTIERVVLGAGPHLEEVHEHPDTKAPLTGATVPQWSSIYETVYHAACAMHHSQIQGWDITLTDEGPVIIELEGDGGHPQMTQLAQGRGLYEGRFKEFYDAAIEKGQKAKAEKKAKKRTLEAIQSTLGTAAQN